MRQHSLRLALTAALFTCSLTAQTTTYNAFVTGSGYTPPSGVAVAPGQIATFFVGGLPQTTAGLADLTAILNVNGATQSAKIIAATATDASTLAITVQLPFAIVPNVASSTGVQTQAPYSIQFAEVSEPQGAACSQNACTPPVNLYQVSALPHIISTCDTFYGNPSTPCQSAVTHQDGSLVTNSAPAQPNETVTIWALGLGVPTAGIPANATGPIAITSIGLTTNYSGRDSAGNYVSFGGSTPYSFAGLPMAGVGLYQINFAVPPPTSDVPSCDPTTNGTGVSGNLVLNINNFSGAFSGLGFSEFGSTTSTTVTVGDFTYSYSSTTPAICVSAN